MPTDRHTETIAVPGRRLGRRAPKHAPALRLGRLLTGRVPDHPAVDDHLSRVPQWILGANDVHGDCGPVSVANSRLLTTTYLTGHPETPDLESIYSLYRRSGNPNFDPVTGVDDNGVDMQTMLEAVHTGGIAGTRCVAFAQVDHTDLDEVRAAIAIFGYLLVGVDLEAAQQTQTDNGLWDYQPSAEWGGHAVAARSYTSDPQDTDMSVVTWAQVVGTTDAFWRHQTQECWAVIWPEHFGHTPFLEGVDTTILALDYQALTGRSLPTPAPVPPPAPIPDAADTELASACRPWVNQRHAGTSATLARHLRDWLRHKGL